MSRSNYSDDCDGWKLVCWRGAVTQAIRGKRGQKLLTDLLVALDAMPYKRLIAEELVKDGEVCALGALGMARGMGETLAQLDPWEYQDIAHAFDVAPALVQEIEFENDEDWYCRHATPEQRWEHMRHWVEQHIIKEAPCLDS